MTVGILGRTLTLRGGTPERLHTVARLVDGQLRELQQAFPASPLSDLAILAAINLAYECLETREDYQELQTEIQARSRQLLQILETHEAASPPGP